MVVSVKCDYKVLGVSFSSQLFDFFYNKHVLLVQNKSLKKENLFKPCWRSIKYSLYIL